MLLGVHISGAKHLYETFGIADKLGCNTMQIFAHSPQRWVNKPLSSEEADKFVSNKSSFKISPVFIHAPYLINLASPDKKLYFASIKAYISDILEANKLSADYFVTHMGSHKETSEDEGLERLTLALDKIAEETKDTSVKILLENTAGGGSSLGYKFSHQQRIFSQLKNRQRFGLCLDTAHAFAAGYDLRAQTGMDRVLDEIDQAAGINNLKLIHLNDSAVKLGSRADRHQHIGKGEISLAGMKIIVNHKTLKNVPFILETPKDTPKSDAMNLKTVRRLRPD